MVDGKHRHVGTVCRVPCAARRTHLTGLGQGVTQLPSAAGYSASPGVKPATRMAGRSTQLMLDATTPAGGGREGQHNDYLQVVAWRAETSAEAAAQLDPPP